MKQSLNYGDEDEKDVGNADETNFIINMDNGRTLGFYGETEIKYSDVMWCGEGMKMMVRVSGGRDSKIQRPFMMFMNKDRSFPIRNVPDDISVVSYCSGLKEWVW